MTRKILVYPDPGLKVVSKPFVGTPEELELVDDLKQTMRAARGLGIAAVQVGVPTRLVVIEGSVDGVCVPMANPVIVAMGTQTQVMTEGCLSFPGVFESVRRYLDVTVTWQDPANLGDHRTQTFHGVRAHAIQHEVEHLEGVLLSDRMSRSRRGTVMGMMKRYGRWV